MGAYQTGFPALRLCGFTTFLFVTPFRLSSTCQQIQFQFGWSVALLLLGCAPPGNNDETFEWTNKSFDVKGVRTIRKHNNKWSLWATKVKALAAFVMTKKPSEASDERDGGHGSTEERTARYNLRKTYWVHLEGPINRTEGCELKGVTVVVFCNGELEPRIVIKQEGGMVTMVKTTNSQDPENPVSHWTYRAEPAKGTPWNIDEEDEMSREGKATATAEGRMPGAAVLNRGGSKPGTTVRMVSDDELETLPRNQVCRAAGEIFAQRHYRKWVKPQTKSLQVLFSGCTNIH